TCDSQRHSPEEHWGAVPAGTKARVVSIWHPAPDQEKSSWLVYNIPADTKKLELNARQVGEFGLNDKRQASYDPPCSQGPGGKTYHISVFALSRILDLPAQSTNRAKMLEAISDCTLAEGTLDCKVERKVKQ
ncbi:MAG: YbhB/YbcL family Raf kinase inhibitor-like protein, partial [Planctomycetota bacterium]